MGIVMNPDRSQWAALCQRNIPNDDAIEQSVREIMDNVKQNGDTALRDYIARFDHFTGPLAPLSEAEIAEGASKVSPEVADAIRRAADNIAKFHSAQLHPDVDIETMPGIRCVQRAVPIQRVGLYIPGGQAPLFSTVLMLAIPARIAGCAEVILATPASDEHPIAPEILFAAKLCGVGRIFRMGGAQAIAAMAFGTESVPRVHKIFGPGNRFVTKAKQLASRFTAIDMPAGPSEVLVMADESARPDFIAADLLSQAEHGPDSQAVAICSSEAQARQVCDAVARFSAMLPRSESIASSLSHSHIIVMDSIDTAIDFVNLYAPEHLIISTRNPWQVADRITAAGSVFLGNYSPESVGDYASGTNHTLPTSGWAVSFNGVNVDSFMRRITYQQLSPEGLKSIAGVVTTMARAESLDAHALAVDIRTNKI